MNPLDAREAEETYEYPARPYTLPMRPVQTFRVLSESGDVPTARTPDWTPEDLAWAERERLIGEITGLPFTPENRQIQEMVSSAQSTDWTQEDSDDFFFPDDGAWSDWYLTAEDARVLRQDGV